MQNKHSRTRVVGVVLAAVLSCGPALVVPALAVAPSGACCLPGGVCQELLDFTCEEQGGSFIGSQVPCADVSCPSSADVPALSFLGLVSAIAALIGAGLYRLLRRRV